MIHPSDDIKVSYSDNEKETNLRLEGISENVKMIFNFTQTKSTGKCRIEIEMPFDNYSEANEILEDLSGFPIELWQEFAKQQQKEKRDEQKTD